MILALDPASNGELAYRAFEAEEKKTGLELTHLAEGSRDVRITFSTIVGSHSAYSPHRHGRGRSGRAGRTARSHSMSRTWSLGDAHRAAALLSRPSEVPRMGRASSGPTSHGRIHTMLMETEQTAVEGQVGKLFNYMTPHGKWSIHSTYSDTNRMMTLSRGGYPVWLNRKDAAELGIEDNDWVEVFNDNGVFEQRCTSCPPEFRVERSSCTTQRSERLGIPISPRRKKPGRDEQLDHADSPQASPHGRWATRSSPTPSTTGDPPV